MNFGVGICVCCLVSTAAGTNQLLGWVRSRDNLSDYTLLSSRQANSEVSCVSRVSAAVPDAQLVTFSSDTGACSAFKCALGLTSCRKCRNAVASGQQVWLKDPSCWTTVLHRVSPSVNFNRNWSDYKAGFGEGPDGNFWIGLDSLHSLTNPTPRKLLMLMKLWDDSQSWALYSNFSVGPESDNYRMMSLGSFSASGASIGDSMSSLSLGQNFSTIDRDNDSYQDNCAELFPGGWWFKACFDAHFTGVFHSYPEALNTAIFARGITWKYPYGLYYSLKEAEMLVY